jgi:hypothetical protein
MLLVGMYCGVIDVREHFCHFIRNSVWEGDSKGERGKGDKCSPSSRVTSSTPNRV